MENRRIFKRNRAGFTLVEVIVVLVILAILAAILIPALTGYIDQANKKRAVSECRACVLSAQTLATEKYGAQSFSEWSQTENVKKEIAAFAETPDSVVGVLWSEKAKVEKLSYEYQTNKYVIYENGVYRFSDSSDIGYFAVLKQNPEKNIKQYAPSVLLDLSEMLKKLLKTNIYEAAGNHNGAYLINYIQIENENAQKLDIIKYLLQSNNIKTDGLIFSDFKIYGTGTDRKISEITTIMYKIGADAFIYYSSGNVYKLDNTLYATSSKIKWENNEKAVIDAIAANPTKAQKLN